MIDGLLFYCLFGIAGGKEQDRQRGADHDKKRIEKGRTNMNQEQLKSLGLNDDVIQRILEDQGKNFVSKTRFNEVNENKKALESQLADRDTQLKDLETKAKGNDDLQKQIKELQKANEDQKAAYDGKIHQMKVDNAIVSALTAAKAKNIDAAKAMLKMDAYDLQEDGTIKGLSDNIKKVKEANPWAFDADQQTSPKPQFEFKDSFKPAEGGDNNQPTKVQSEADLIWNAMNGVFPNK